MQPINFFNLSLIKSINIHSWVCLSFREFFFFYHQSALRILDVVTYEDQLPLATLLFITENLCAIYPQSQQTIQYMLNIKTF